MLADIENTLLNSSENQGIGIQGVQDDNKNSRTIMIHITDNNHYVFSRQAAKALACKNLEELRPILRKVNCRIDLRPPSFVTFYVGQ